MKFLCLVAPVLSICLALPFSAFCGTGSGEALEVKTAESKVVVIDKNGVFHEVVMKKNTSIDVHEGDTVEFDETPVNCKDKDNPECKPKLKSVISCKHHSH